MIQSVVSYHLGGFDPDAQAGNRAECWDGDAGTYTRWDTDGQELETRPLTADELAALAPARLSLGELVVDRYTLPADGATHAVARYGADDVVHFVVDGIVQTVVPVDGVAELEIAAAAPGAISVQVRDRAFVLVAEGA